MQANDKPRDSKKLRYVKPTVTELGNVRDLTRAIFGSTSDGTGLRPKT